jgi:hypothetical protein
LGKQFGEYFEKLASQMEEIGHILNRLPRYPHLYPDNPKLKASLVDIYQAIFDFCTRARRVFRLGKSKSSGLKRFSNAVALATAIRLIWKPFSVQFSGIKERLAKNVSALETEADVAEKELASKERRRDDERWTKAEQTSRAVAEFIDDQSIAKVNAWLSPANVAANHKAAANVRHGDTGRWFLGGADFRRWLEEDNSFLWLHAIRECFNLITSFPTSN